MSTATKPTRRGTSNANTRGSAENRRRRREWLVETYRADVDVEVVYLVRSDGEDVGTETLQVTRGFGAPACRCYRCGVLLTVDTVTVDRIIPGCKGGTYRRDNIRPCCGTCNSSTGACLGNERRRSA